MQFLPYLLPKKCPFIETLQLLFCFGLYVLPTKHITHWQSLKTVNIVLEEHKLVFESTRKQKSKYIVNYLHRAFKHTDELRSVLLQFIKCGSLFPKDIRIIIAKLIWSERERPHLQSIQKLY